jgi:hypothetical protein
MHASAARAGRKPNFFIVGKPKSGTTALHAMLGQHPDVFMSAFKEPHHFARDHIENALKRGRGYRGLPYRNRDTYLELFSGARNERIVGESSTNYLYSRVAAREIANFNPDAKILMFLREPVDFLCSYQKQLVRTGQENVGDFRKALELEETRKKGQQIPATVSNPGALFYTDQAKYCEQVGRFLEAFARDQVKIVIYEDFKKDNLATCKDVFRFLGVDPEFAPCVTAANPTRDVRATRLANWLIYHWDRKEGSIKQRAPAWLTRPVGWLAGKLFFSSRPPAPLDEGLKQELRARFRPEVVELSDMIGVDVAKKWGYSRPDGDGLALQRS